MQEPLSLRKIVPLHWDAFLFHSRGVYVKFSAHRDLWCHGTQYDVNHRVNPRYDLFSSAKYNGMPTAAMLNRSWLATACVICYRGRNEFIAYFSWHNFRPDSAVGNVYLRRACSRLWVLPRHCALGPANFYLTLFFSLFKIVIRAFTVKSCIRSRPFSVRYILRIFFYINRTKSYSHIMVYVTANRGKLYIKYAFAAFLFRIFCVLLNPLFR